MENQPLFQIIISARLIISVKARIRIERGADEPDVRTKSALFVENKRNSKIRHLRACFVNNFSLSGKTASEYAVARFCLCAEVRCQGVKVLKFPQLEKNYLLCTAKCELTH